jgi:VWFA-related protein
VERVAVDIVNVEVYVTDKEGNPISELTREDFEVTEDGRPVEVVNFYHVVDGVPKGWRQPESAVESKATEPASGEEQVPRLLPEAPELVVPESQRLHMVIYVDNFNIHPLNRNRVFSRLRVFLYDNVKAGDEVMVASYDRSLHVRQPFTSSPDLVASVLREIEGMSGSAIERESERSDAIKAIYETDSLHVAEFQAKTFAENQYHEINNTLDAVREMLDSLAGLPGRKMLVHVSDGLPMVPGQDLYQAIQSRFAAVTAMGEAFSYDLSRRYSQIIAHANSNRVSFYTIDAGGLRTQSGMGAESATINAPLPVARAVEAVRTNNLQDTLIMMANRTGGQYIINTNDVSAGLERFARDIGNYYSLGYRAPTVERGRYHRIEVRLTDESKGWRLRHREGYRDKSLEAQLEDSVRAFLVHGYETNPLGVSIDLEGQSPRSDGNFAVSVRVRIPTESVLLLPRGEFFEGRLRLYFGATDEKGREAPLQEMPLELRIPESSIERARQDEVARVIDATMRPGPHKLVVAVRDEISEERSVVGLFLAVGDVQSLEKDEQALPKALQDL